ncbi:hypothetical protein D3C80_2094700 [compost metagenome]
MKKTSSTSIPPLLPNKQVSLASLLVQPCREYPFFAAVKINADYDYRYYRFGNQLMKRQPFRKSGKQQQG